MKAKTITICSSAHHYKDVLELEKRLVKMGYKVRIPKTARIMQKTKNFHAAFYKTWYKNKKDYSKKRQLMLGHFKKILDSHAILVLNLEKNGIKGYIGGNVLMEMALAFYYKKPIFIYNDISEDLPVKEEIFGLAPIFIRQNLQILHKKMSKVK